MNFAKPAITPIASSLDSQPATARLSNESLAKSAAPHRPYSWGPAGDVRSGRFFTGAAWGPKRS